MKIHELITLLEQEYPASEVVLRFEDLRGTADESVQITIPEMRVERESFDTVAICFDNPLRAVIRRRKV